MAGVFPNSGVPAVDAINSTNVETTGCEAGGQLFHSTSRCQPRFDPASANAVISEILNAVEGAGITYDCTRLDNLRLALEGLFQRGAEACWDDIVIIPNTNPVTNPQTVLGLREIEGCLKLVQIPNWIEEFKDSLEVMLTQCLDVDFPELDDVCGTVRSLVIVEDPGGCGIRIASFSESGAASGSGTFGDIASHLTPNTSGFTLPADFAVPTSYYTLTGLRTDDASGFGTINSGRILNSRLASATFENPCEKRYEVVANWGINPSTDANAAYARRASVTYRWRVGLGTWTYPRNSLNEIITWKNFNGINVSEEVSQRLTFPTGSITFEVIYLAEQIGGSPEPVIIAANTNLSGGDVGSPRLSIRPAI